MFTMQDAINEQWTKHPKFWEGHKDGKALNRAKEYENVDGQAYDRGYQVGMNESKKFAFREPGPKFWGDEPGIETRVGCN
jgi:hypothetical protein